MPNFNQTHRLLVNAILKKDRQAITILLGKIDPEYINAQDQDGWNLLMWTIVGDDCQTAKTLIKDFFNLKLNLQDVCGKTAFMEAARKGYDSLVSMMLAIPPMIKLQRIIETT